jgi:small-conductance mechanosensitive channel
MFNVAHWNFERLSLPLGIAVASVLVLLALRRIFLVGLSKRIQHKFPVVGDHLIAVFRGPSVFLCISAGLYIGIALSELPTKYSVGLTEATHTLVIFSITLALANLAAAIFKNFMARTHGEQTSGLLVNLIHVTVMAVGVLIILSVLGISIAPLLTALGVGGLAVALALKDTLENLFAGIYLLSDRAISVGDYVKLESGSEGFVEDIGWRTTRVRLSDLNMLIVPNSKLAQSGVINFCLPNRNLQASLVVSVSYNADPERVESELLKIVNDGSEDITGLISKPTPVVRFNSGFNPDSLDFTVYFHVKDFSDQSFVRHELKKRIVTQFKKAGIPFPERQVTLSQTTTTST